MWATVAPLGAGADGIASAQEDVGLIAALAKQAAHLLQNPVEHLLDDDRDDVEERVDAAHAHQHEEEVGHPVEALVSVSRALAADKIPKPDGAEGDKAEVERVQVSPALHGGVHGGRTAGDGDGRQAQDQHDVVDGRLPAGEGVRREVMADPRREQTAVPDSPLPHGLHHHGQQRDDALKEEVEEEDGGSAAQKPVKDQEHFAGHRHGRCHPKT